MEDAWMDVGGDEAACEYALSIVRYGLDLGGFGSNGWGTRDRNGGHGFDDKGKSRFFAHHPRTCPKEQSSLGPLKRSGTPFAQNDTSSVLGDGRVCWSLGMTIHFHCDGVILVVNKRVQETLDVACF